MKRSDLTKYISVFVLAVFIIAVYKTFDSIGVIFSYLGAFVGLFTPIFVALAIAFILCPLCIKFEEMFSKSKVNFFKKHRRGASVFVIYVLFVIVITAFMSVLFPAIMKSISDFVIQMPEIAQNIKRFLNEFEVGDYRFKDFINKISFTEVFSTFSLNNLQTYLNSVLSASKFVVNFLLAIVISIYILLDRRGLISTARRIGELVLPEKSRSVIIKYVNRTFNIMYKYVYCQLADVLIVFVLALCVLVAMGVRYAPVLAVFIGVFNIIPYFGAVIACVVTALLTVFTSSVSKGIWVAVALIVIQQLDANLIQPRLVRDALHVKPFWVLCGISVGGGLFGILGIILAVPALALAKTLFDDYYDYVKTKKISDEDNKNAENDDDFVQAE